MEDMHTLISTFHHHINIQVRFKDIDKLGHVNNANHLTYFEMGRVKYFDDVFRNKINWEQVSMILAKSEITYKRPITLSDQLVCYTKISKIGTKSFDTDYLLVSTHNNELQLCAYGKSVMVCYNYVTKQTMEIPQEWIDSIKKFEKI